MNKQPKDYQEFYSLIMKLVNRGVQPDDNYRTDGYLEAMAAWLYDTEGGDGVFRDNIDGGISWRDLNTLIRAGTVYE